MNDNPHARSLGTRLLARHASADPQLDAIRRAILARRAADSAPVSISQLLPALFAPHCRLWAALAATWLLLFALQLSRASSDPIPPPSPTFAHSSAPRSTYPPFATHFAEYQAQLHALLR